MMKTVRDFDVKNKRVLVRCDFNVPLDEQGNITDDFRIKQTLPTIEYLLKNKAKVILMSHLADNRSLDVVWDRVKKYLGAESREIIFLDNLRINKGEEENDDNFARELAKLGDIYINDAFGVCHRAHASVVGVPKYLPSGAGFLLEKEVKILSMVLESPRRPLTAIIGGVKIESKSKVIEKFLEKADYLLIGGKIANVVSIESDKLYLPVDSNNSFDIGSQTIKLFSEVIKKAKMIFWSGPMGRFEEPEYEEGTKAIAEAISSNQGAFKVAGGGDTLFAISKFGLQDKFDHLSTGGGAMLSFLGGEILPGLEALKWKSKI